MRILVGLYSAGSMHKDFFPQFIKFWDENCKLYDLELCYMHRFPVHLAQNNIAAKSMGYDYLMFVEDDTTFFPVGLLTSLIQTHKTVIAPRAYSRYYNNDLMAFKKTADCLLDTDINLFDKIKPASHESGIERVDLLHFMCMLIQPNIFTMLDYPYFHYGKNGTGTDSYFCENLARNKVNCYVHHDWTVGHCGILGNEGASCEVHPITH
jgi:hypothetical protein